MTTNLKFSLVASVLAALLVGQAPGLAQPDEPLYTYQSIHTLIAHRDNRISLRVWADGRVEMRFPPYSPQAGHYQWRASEAELERLDNLFAPFLQADAETLERERATSARGEGEVVTVADADLVRFSARLPDRQSTDLLIESPRAWRRVSPQARQTANLAEAEARILEWMRSNIQREQE